MCTDKELPKYKCNKQVWALQIADINNPVNEIDGSAIITPTNDTYTPFKVDAEYMKKHNPHIGGYYIMYKDGYKSFSPAKPFEDGYTLI